MTDWSCCSYTNFFLSIQTMPIPRRSARLAAKGTGAPMSMPNVPDTYVTQLSFNSRWRDKDYGDVSITDWFFTIFLTINTDENQRYMHSFWHNRVYITDTYIKFGSMWSSLTITNIDGLVQLSDYNSFLTRTHKNIPFHPSMTFDEISKKLKKHLVQTGDSEYRFNYEVPVGMYPDDYSPPPYDITCI